VGGPEPSLTCDLCPRLSAFRAASRALQPGWHNAPVLSFGDATARLAIVGLAPGLQGANRTGRPFTGDYAGLLLYDTLLTYGFASGCYDARADDGLMLRDTIITNAVRCVPPQNKPTPEEITTCRSFLTARLAALHRLQVVVALGRVAHDSTIVALGGKRSAYKFAHGARHDVQAGIVMFDSYHCSRYNTNTGVLTPQMFRDVFAAARAHLDEVREPVSAQARRLG
jgi:uracil-DNA glycosylase